MSTPEELYEEMGESLKQIVIKWLSENSTDYVRITLTNGLTYKVRVMNFEKDTDENSPTYGIVKNATIYLRID